MVTGWLHEDDGRFNQKRDVGQRIERGKSHYFRSVAGGHSRMVCALPTTNDGYDQGRMTMSFLGGGR
jgi:hypothetical protein